MNNNHIYHGSGHSLNFILLLLIALASHGILSKYIYAKTPTGVPIEQAEIGGMLMYYGGDAIGIILIFIFYLQWFKASRYKQKYITQ